MQTTNSLFTNKTPDDSFSLFSCWSLSLFSVHMWLLLLLIMGELVVQMLCGAQWWHRDVLGTVGTVHTLLSMDSTNELIERKLLKKRKAEAFKPEGLFRSCLFGATRNIVLGLVLREPTKHFTQPMCDKLWPRLCKFKWRTFFCINCWSVFYYNIMVFVL